MAKNPKGHILYRIFYDDDLVYLGRTNQPLNTRLRGHFINRPMQRKLECNSVTKIEYINFSAEADMNLYEIYFINKYKPPLNCDDKARDDLTVSLPEPEWVDHWPDRMSIWLQELKERDARIEKISRAQIRICAEGLPTLRKNYHDGKITEEQYCHKRERIQNRQRELADEKKHY